jgi:putative CocE/NonD family hydrolase
MWWATSMAPDLRRRVGKPGTVTGAEARAAWERGEGQSLLYFLPWSELPERVFETETPYVRAWLKAPHEDPWKLDQACKEIDVPNLDVVGWFDHCNGDMLLYRTMVKEGRTERARRGQRLIIGPWGHDSRGQRKFGDIDFGPDAELDLRAEELRWFDYHLQGKPALEQPPVKIFVMGVNRWREEAEWPLTRGRPMELFLGSDGPANTPAGQGKLLRTPPPTAATDRYVYDPRDPVPTLFSPRFFTGVSDRRPLAHRQDILVYLTEPLREPLEVTGHPTVELVASSSAPDTDFIVRLIDVAPDGLARDVSMGLVRARYRNGLERPALLAPGEVVAYRIRMNPTSNVFLPGHRLRLDVTSSDFPNYDRNHNTPYDQNADARLAVAEQTIHLGGQRASKLILPQIAPGR